MLNAWNTSLATIGQGINESDFLHALFSIVLQSFAIYFIYRVLRWGRTKRDGTNQSVLNSPGTEPTQQKDPNRDREPGGMLDVEFSVRRGH